MVVEADGTRQDGEIVDMPGTTPDAASGWTPPTWEEIVREHSARVYRLAYRLTGNSHDAEDLTQEVFVRVFRSLSSYTPGTFEGWLHRITTNLFLDMARRRQRIRFEGLGDDTAQRLRGDEPTPAQAFDERHLDGDIQAALKALAPEYRAAVVLCDIEGLSYEEIADTLGVKLGTVRSRIHRGRAQLRTALDHRRPRRPAIAPKVAAPVAAAPVVAAPVVAAPASALVASVSAVVAPVSAVVASAQETAAVPPAGDL
jgi:RNA polymerase sigma factor (sigma-70 family)